MPVEPNDQDDGAARVGADAAADAAAAWLIALQEAPDDDDVQAHEALLERFRHWLAADPAHAAAWAEIGRFDALYARTVPRHPAAWRERSAEAPAPPRPTAVRLRRPWLVRPRPRRVTAGLVGAAVAAGLMLLMLPGLLLQLRADHVTGTAEIRTIRLPDGSTAHLAPRSAIALAFEETARDVDLLTGEALFEVVRDPARPFRVAAGAVSATAVGTAFAVARGRSTADATGVAGAEGRVRVEAPAARPPVAEELAAGDWIRIGSEQTRRGRRNPADAAPWIDRKLVARDRPLAEVVDRLRPFFAGYVLVADADLGRRPVTGVYDLSNPAEALRAIAAAHDAHVTAISPWLLVLRP
jgi:transmembrane sensor